MSATFLQEIQQLNLCQDAVFYRNDPLMQMPNIMDPYGQILGIFTFFETGVTAGHRAHASSSAYRLFSRLFSSFSGLV